MASEPDESSIIFEPYNLDNSIALFHDGPKAAHGVRYISKDIAPKWGSRFHCGLKVRRRSSMELFASSENEITECMKH